MYSWIKCNPTTCKIWRFFKKKRRKEKGKVSELKCLFVQPSFSSVVGGGCHLNGVPFLFLSGVHCGPSL